MVQFGHSDTAVSTAQAADVVATAIANAAAESPSTPAEQPKDADSASESCAAATTAAPCRRHSLPTSANALKVEQRTALHTPREAARLVTDSQVYAWCAKRQAPGVRVVRRFLSRRKRSELEQVFKALDTDGSGGIDREEVCFALRELGLSAEHANAILSEGDANQDDTLTLDEFLSLVATVQSRSRVERRRPALAEVNGSHPSRGSRQAQQQQRLSAKAAHTFTELVDNASSHPIQLLANAHYIKNLVSGYDPALYKPPLSDDDDELPQPPPPQPPIAKQVSLPAMMQTRAASAPIAIKRQASSSHSRWLAKLARETAIEARQAEARRPSTAWKPVQPQGQRGEGRQQGHHPTSSRQTLPAGAASVTTKTPKQAASSQQLTASTRSNHGMVMRSSSAPKSATSRNAMNDSATSIGLPRIASK